jgi:hypothetical protein
MEGGNGAERGCERIRQRGEEWAGGSGNGEAKRARRAIWDWKIDAITECRPCSASFRESTNEENSGARQDSASAGAISPRPLLPAPRRLSLPRAMGQGGAVAQRVKKMDRGRKKWT